MTGGEGEILKIQRNHTSPRLLSPAPRSPRRSARRRTISTCACSRFRSTSPPTPHPSCARARALSHRPTRAWPWSQVWRRQSPEKEGAQDKNTTQERGNAAQPPVFFGVSAGVIVRANRAKDRDLVTFFVLSLSCSQFLVRVLETRVCDTETRRRRHSRDKRRERPRTRARTRPPRARKDPPRESNPAPGPSPRVRNKKCDGGDDGTHDVGCADGILGLGGRANMISSGARLTSGYEASMPIVRRRLDVDLCA